LVAINRHNNYEYCRVLSFMIIMVVIFAPIVQVRPPFMKIKQTYLLPQQAKPHTIAHVGQPVATPDCTPPVSVNIPGLPWYVGAAATITALWNGNQLYSRVLAPFIDRNHYAQLHDTVINKKDESPVERNRAIAWRYVYGIGHRRGNGQLPLTLPTIVRTTQEGINNHHKTLAHNPTAQQAFAKTNMVNYAPSHKSPLAENDFSNLRLPGRITSLVPWLWRYWGKNPALRFILPGRQIHPPANFSGTYLNDVVHDDANLSQASLPGANFSNTSLKRANFSNAGLVGANFDHSNLFKAFIKNAKLAGASFMDTKGLPSVALEMANDRMPYINIGSTNPQQPMAFTRQTLEGKDLRYLNAKHLDLMATVLKNTNLRYAHIGNPQAPGQPNNVRLLGADLSNANAQKAQLTHMDFTLANLYNAQLNGADLTGANFSAAQLVPPPNTSHKAASLHGRKNHPTRLAGANFRGQTMDGQNLSYTILDNIQVQPDPLYKPLNARVRYYGVTDYLKPVMLTPAELAMDHNTLTEHLNDPGSPTRKKIIDLAKVTHYDNTAKRLALPEVKGEAVRGLLADALTFQNTLLQPACTERTQKQTQLRRDALKALMLANTGHYKTETANRASFSGVNFSHASVQGVNWQGINLAHANFAHANLTGCQFAPDTQLAGADFRGAKGIDWSQIAQHPDRNTLILDDIQKRTLIQLIQRRP
jgi:uncharacterized protein YjbI with pentapeptide repeats